MRVVVLATILNRQSISKLVGEIYLANLDTFRVFRARPPDSLLWDVTISRPEFHMNFQYPEIG